LFNRCGLRNTTIPARYRKGGLVGSFTEAPGGELKPQQYAMKDLEPPTPAGGVISTATDLARWNECLHGGKLLEASTYKLMTTVYAARPHARWGEVGYGYGLQVDHGGGVLRIQPQRHPGRLYRHQPVLPGLRHQHRRARKRRLGLQRPNPHVLLPRPDSPVVPQPLAQWAALILNRKSAKKLRHSVFDIQYSI
jgi:CubicO group peptidase (beta-lactamase class C family)